MSFMSLFLLLYSLAHVMLMYLFPMATQSSQAPKRRPKSQGGGQKKRPRGNNNKKKSSDEVQELCRRVVEGAPEPGSNPSNAELPTDGWGYIGAEMFEDLPLSEMTKKGLRDANFVSMTAIQKSALPHALAGRDILGAAKTGSGKTLAFVIPVCRMRCWSGD